MYMIDSAGGCSMVLNRCWAPRMVLERSRVSLRSRLRSQSFQVGKARTLCTGHWYEDCCIPSTARTET